MLKVAVITLFPELITPYCKASILGRAQQQGQVQVRTFNPRDFTLNKHKKVDDTPYGGGSGMVLQVQPVEAAYHAWLQSEALTEETLQEKKHKLIMTSPVGAMFNHQTSVSWSRLEHLVLFCGHYEGFDERLFQRIPALESASLGDFVLTGGELAALAMLDSVVRQLPGAVGDFSSVMNDSFYDGLLDYPHYSKPADYEGLKVPEVLLSGNHGKIESWRRLQSLWRTWQARPDLLDSAPLSKQDKKWLAAFQQGETPETLL